MDISKRNREKKEERKGNEIIRERRLRIASFNGFIVEL
jgi:hypothetical protein